MNAHVGHNGWPALVLNADFRPLSYYPLSLWSWVLGDLLLTGSADRKARLWDLKTGQIVKTLIGHGGNVIKRKERLCPRPARRTIFGARTTKASSCSPISATVTR